MTRRIWINGYWNDTKKYFEAQCQIGGGYDEDTDSPEDDDQIFYYFLKDEAIIANHGDFTVTGFQD